MYQEVFLRMPTLILNTTILVLVYDIINVHGNISQNMESLFLMIFPQMEGYSSLKIQCVTLGQD